MLPSVLRVRVVGYTKLQVLTMLPFYYVHLI